MVRFGMSCLVVTAVLGSLGSSAFAQAGGKPQDPPKPAAGAPAAKEKVVVIFLGNDKCPNSGKAVNQEKFAEVDGQRVYVCSDACIDAVKKDPKGMIAKAYPAASVKAIESKTCVCTMPIEAGKATEITWEGHKISCCSAACADVVKKTPATAIALLMHPGSKDIKNTTDPIDGKPIDPFVIAFYKNTIIHFAKPANIAAFEKDPDAILAKIKPAG